MALTYVGHTASAIVPASGVTQTVLGLNTLTGGTGGNLQQGDLLIAMCMGVGQHTFTCTVMQTGFTQHVATNFTASELARSVRRQVGRKLVGSDPSTEQSNGVNFNIAGNGSRPFILTVQVWRGVDQTVPWLTGTGFTHTSNGSGRVVNGNNSTPFTTSAKIGSKTIYWSTVSSSLAGDNPNAQFPSPNTGNGPNALFRADGAVASAIGGLQYFDFSGTQVTPGSWDVTDAESSASYWATTGITIQPAESDAPFDVENGSAALAAGFSSAGEILAGINHDLANGTLSVGAALSIAGELLPGTDFALANGQVVIVGGLSVPAGTDLVYSFAPPPIAQPTSGWIRRRPTGRRRSGSKRVYDMAPEKPPVILPPSARKIVDRAPPIKGPEPRTLRDYLTLKADSREL